MNRWILTGLGVALCGGLALAEMPRPTGTGTTAEGVSPTSREFQLLDANGDGRVSVTEARRDDQLSNSFQSLDADGDGKLTEQEYERHAKNAATETRATPGNPAKASDPDEHAPARGADMPGGSPAATPGTR